MAVKKISTNDITITKVMSNDNAIAGYKNTLIIVSKNKATAKITVPVYTDFTKLLI